MVTAAFRKSFVAVLLVFAIDFCIPAAGEEISIMLPGDVPLTLVRVPAGTFMMGSPESERGHKLKEVWHQVTLTQDYYLGKTEVTQRQWAAVMGGSNPSYFTTCGLDCPVEQVSWNDICGGTSGSTCMATSFIGKVNQLLETSSFRLPTEAEWERAARAETQTEFSFTAPLGWDITCNYWNFVEAMSYMWWCGNARTGTHPVSTKMPNMFGLYDMHGNVSEWVADWYSDYSSATFTDPTGPASGQYGVIRGGSQVSNAVDCRSAFRFNLNQGTRNYTVGFRLARSTDHFGSFSHSYWISVASHASGDNKSQWRTDLGLLNLNSSTSDYEIRWYSTNEVKMRNGSLLAGSQSILADVVDTIGGYGSGALEVRSSKPLIVTSRTYNLIASDSSCSPNGTLGQDYPSFQPSDGIATGQSAGIGQLTENELYRTNIGITNSGATIASVTVTLNDGIGTPLTTYSVNLNPGEWKQENQPFRKKAGKTNIQQGYAKATVTSGSGVYLYGSVVDNLTNDPTTILMMKQ